MAKKKAPAYVLVRTNWEVVDNGFQHGDEHHGRPVAVYDDLKQARADAAALEQEARQTANPFRFTSDIDAKDEVLLKLAAALDLPKPFKLRRPDNLDHDWATWYDAVRPSLTDADLAKIWKLFPRVKFFRVEKSELEG